MWMMILLGMIVFPRVQ